MPFCTNCGSEITGKMLFCPECGNKLSPPKAGARDEKAYDSGGETEGKKAESTVPDSFKKSRLYKQWVEYAGLPAEEIPAAPAKKERPARKEAGKQNIYILYMLLGLIIIILGTGLAFLFMFMEY